MHNRFVGEDLYNGQLVESDHGPGRFRPCVVTVSADFASATGTRPIVFLYCPVQDPQTGKTSWQVVDRKEISDITKGFRQAHRAAEGHFVALHPQHIA